jgi:asparagine synthetase B (glutamine-hydrolysing)
VRRALPRHVRVRHLGHEAEAAAAGARPHGHQAALLDGAARPAALRIRDQVDLESGSSPRSQRARVPELLSTRYLSGAETLFKGIYRLQPGHVLVFERGVATTRQWWDVPVGNRVPDVESLSDEQAVSQFRRGSRTPCGRG